MSFTGSTNAPSGQTYTATACANSGVGFGCVTQTPFVSGSAITGLTPGTSYYVTITANSSGPLYLPATSATAGPVPATIQLNAPGTPTLDWGTVAGLGVDVLRDADARGARAGLHRDGRAPTPR